jgi:hypothetical protein
VKRLKKTLVFLTALLLIVSMAYASVAQATNYELKNNSKFEAFSTASSFNIMTWFAGQKEYIPSMEKVNLYKLSWDESFITYDITVGSKTYHLCTDFTYTGHVKYTFHDVEAWSTSGGLPPYIWPSEYSNVQAVVDYTYDFSTVPGGLDGTIHMQCIMNNAGKTINSLDSTGDFQNIQIKAVVDTSPPNQGLTYYLAHHGIVSGWPE